MSAIGVALNGALGMGPVAATYNTTAAAIPFPEEKRPSPVTAVLMVGKMSFRRCERNVQPSKRFHTR